MLGGGRGLASGGLSRAHGPCREVSWETIQDQRDCAPRIASAKPHGENKLAHLRGNPSRVPQTASPL